MNIYREKYFEKITPFLNKPIIKIITGMRRVGKSYFLKQIIDHLKVNGASDDKIIFIDKDDIDFDFIENYKDLNKYINNKISAKKEKYYLLIDEVQEIENWEKVITSLQKKESVDIFLTGSNAHLLSSELATLLSGRYIEINIFPLSYSEFVLFKGTSFVSHTDCFAQYLRYGGMPGLFHLEQTDDTIYKYLESIFNTILFKDIIKKNNVRNISLLEKIYKFLFENIGNLITANSISKYLKTNVITWKTAS